MIPSVMYEIVTAMDGFISADSYKNTEGDDLSVMRFASLEALRAWREHPEHLAAQAKGKAEIYDALEAVLPVAGSPDISGRARTSPVRIEVWRLG